MHGILAVSEFVDSCWKWPSIRNTLVVRIEITSALSTVCQSINSPVGRTASEPSSVLIKVISHGPSGRQGLAAVLSARVVGLKFMLVVFHPWQSESQLYDNKQTQKNLECLHSRDFIFYNFYYVI
jgi:hypothetical protein